MKRKREEDDVVKVEPVEVNVFRLNDENRSDEIINIPEGYLSIAANAFDNCKNLISVTIPDTVVKIGKSAFRKCEMLKSVRLPKNLKIIEECLFEDCYKLLQIIIPEGVEKIEERVFLNCNNLKSVEIPNSVNEIGLMAFLNCKRLTKIVIPEGVETITRGCFRWCMDLEIVKIPKSVTCIDIDAFANCISLQSIELPPNLETIENSVFYNCRDLKSVTMHEKIQEIEHDAFLFCYSLESFNFLCSYRSSINIYYHSFQSNSLIVNFTDVKFIGRKTINFIGNEVVTINIQRRDAKTEQSYQIIKRLVTIYDKVKEEDETITKYNYFTDITFADYRSTCELLSKQLFQFREIYEKEVNERGVPLESYKYLVLDESMLYDHLNQKYNIPEFPVFPEGANPTFFDVIEGKYEDVKAFLMSNEKDDLERFLVYIYDKFVCVRWELIDDDNLIVPCRNYNKTYSKFDPITHMLFLNLRKCCEMPGYIYIDKLVERKKIYIANRIDVFIPAVASLKSAKVMESGNWRNVNMEGALHCQGGMEENYVFCLNPVEDQVFKKNLRLPDVVLVLDGKNQKHHSKKKNFKRNCRIGMKKSKKKSNKIQNKTSRKTFKKSVKKPHKKNSRNGKTNH